MGDVRDFSARRGGPCFHCLFPQPPAGGSLDTCETAGVLAPIVDTIASLQAMEAIKLLTGNEQALHGSLVQIDMWLNGWNSLSLAGARRPQCPVCSAHQYARLSGEHDEPLTASLCGRNTVQVVPHDGSTAGLTHGRTPEPGAVSARWS
ncbi:ThiF family adenylyltransferase [Cohnella faecalis]|uniref:ThiF family adenylyltransferase n=1 Tax=Cohnella faecalis TaxID=2315694 RepID=UPI0039891E86